MVQVLRDCLPPKRNSDSLSCWVFLIRILILLWVLGCLHDVVANRESKGESPNLLRGHETFPSGCCVWGESEWAGRFPKECFPVWYHSYGNLKLQDKPGRPAKCKWHEARERRICSLLTTLPQNKMSEFLPFVEMSFPGVLKAKLPCRRKGQGSSRGEVIDTNPNSCLRRLLWEQTLTQKWQKTGDVTKQRNKWKPRFVLGRATCWEREGKSSCSLAYLPLFTCTWTRDDKKLHAFWWAPTMWF